MRSTKADKQRNTLHSPTAANRASVSRLNNMTLAFDVLRTRISDEKLSSVDSREQLNEYKTELSGAKWMSQLPAVQTMILM